MKTFLFTTTFYFLFYGRTALLTFYHFVSPKINKNKKKLQTQKQITKMKPSNIQSHKNQKYSSFTLTWLIVNDL